MQVFAGAALYLYLPENILLACNFLPNYCFFVLFVHLPVEDWLWLFLISSKQCFCPYKPYLLHFK
jgi:hypothetical protein